MPRMGPIAGRRCVMVTGCRSVTRTERSPRRLRSPAVKSARLNGQGQLSLPWSGGVVPLIVAFFLNAFYEVLGCADRVEALLSRMTAQVVQVIHHPEIQVCGGPFREVL